MVRIIKNNGRGISIHTTMRKDFFLQFRIFLRGAKGRKNFP